MAPSAIHVASLGLQTVSEEPTRPSKRLKVTQPYSQLDVIADEEPAAIPSHPLSVKPSGNAYTASINSKASAGAFAQLPDELLISLLESFEAKILLSLGQTCRALYAFSRAEELWRALFVQ